MKRVMCLLMAFMLLVLPLTGVCATANINGFNKVSMSSWKSYPVYSAPFTTAWRGSNGLAEVSGAGGVYAVGWDGDWLLIMYRTGMGVTRVGYISFEGDSYAKEEYDFPKLDFYNRPVTVNQSCIMTDDPQEYKSTMTTLEAGTEVVYLSSYTHTRAWAYIQTTIQGKIARGFVPMECVGQQQVQEITESKMNPDSPVGDYVVFGRYGQDLNYSSKEPIEWLVLDYDADSDQMLLLSRYCLEYKTFDQSNSYPTWAQSDIRTWLNKTFLDEAFNDQEKAAIILSLIVTPANNGIYGGAATNDRVFLLSHPEVKQYLSSSKERRAGATDYVIAMGAEHDYGYKVDDKFATDWWLRSPGEYNTDAYKVILDGTLDRGQLVNRKCAVRPAMWVKASALSRLEQDDSKKDDVLPDVTKDAALLDAVKEETTEVDEQIQCYGVITGKQVPMYQKTSAKSRIVDYLETGDVVYIRGQEYVNGACWHAITNEDNRDGYVQDDQVRMMTIVEEEEYLASKNGNTNANQAASEANQLTASLGNTNVYLNAGEEKRVKFTAPSAGKYVFILNSSEWAFGEIYPSATATERVAMTDLSRGSIIYQMKANETVYVNIMFVDTTVSGNVTLSISK